MTEEEAEAAAQEYRQKHMSLQAKAELELKERLAKRRKPLRKPSYEEARQNKDKASFRKRARYLQRQAEAEQQPKKETTQAKLIPEAKETTE